MDMFLLGLFGVTAIVNPKCVDGQVAVARAAVVLYADPTAFEAASKILKDLTIRTADCDFTSEVLALPMPFVGATGLQYPPLDREQIRVRKAGLSSGEYSCRRLDESNPECTTAVAIEKSWAGNRAAATLVSEFVDEPLKWVSLLERRGSRTAAIQEAMSSGDSRLRGWVLKEVFLDPDPRNWSIDETAAAFVQARRDEKTEKAALEAHAASLVATRTIEIVSDGGPGFDAPMTCEFLHVARRMGVRNASELLEVRSIRIPDGRPDFAENLESWGHVPDELVAYRADFSSGTHPEGFNAYAINRWLDLDAKARTPDLPKLRRRIKQMESAVKERDR